MGEKETYAEQMEAQLKTCEVKVGDIRSKLRNKGDEISGEARGDLDDLEGQLKSCRLELEDLKDKQQGEWQDAKNSIVKKWDQLHRNLNLAARKYI